jgi:hypothetical protein
MGWVRFETTIPVFERAKTVHALGRAATVIDIYNIYTYTYIPLEYVFAPVIRQIQFLIMGFIKSS